MDTLSKLFSQRAWAQFLTDPQKQRLHALIIGIALAVHLALHYATYVPALRPIVGNLPYMRLHVLHEAEFLLIVVYAAITLRLKGGLTAVGITGVTSIPFLLTPYIFGRAPRTGEIRDLAIQVAFILAMGVLMVLLYEAVARLRETRLALLAQLEETNQRLEAANQQLTGLNQVIQGRLNRLYGELQETLEKELEEVEAAPPDPLKERFSRFLHRVSDMLTGQG